MLRSHSSVSPGLCYDFRPPRVKQLCGAPTRRGTEQPLNCLPAPPGMSLRAPRSNLPRREGDCLVALGAEPRCASDLAMAEWVFVCRLAKASTAPSCHLDRRSAPRTGAERSGREPAVSLFASSDHRPSFDYSGSEAGSQMPLRTMRGQISRLRCATLEMTIGGSRGQRDGNCSSLSTAPQILFRGPAVGVKISR